MKKVLNVGSLKATTAYSYDKNGNLINEKSSYNMSYTKACKCLKSFDGLEITKGETTYKYDNENRLIATFENGKLIQAILYDGNGNRAYTLDRENATSDSSAASVYENKRFSLFGRKCSSSKNDSNSISYDKSIIKNELLKEYGISKFSAASYELTGYVTDLTQEYSQVLMEYGATGKVTNVYSYAEGRVSAIIDGRSYSYLNDGRGSVSELTMTSGSTAVSYRYDIYGKTLASNKCINNPYQYNAEYTDSTTGLQYLRARYYNSDTHRFQTKDTYQGNTAQPITRNNYAYANNNPVNFVDPSGHAFLSAFATKVVVSGAINGVISGAVSAYSQYKSNGGNINWGKVAKDTAVGFVSGAVGAVVGNSIEKKFVGKVASKVLSYVGSGAASATTGAAERGVSTALNNRLNPASQRQNILKNAFDPRSMATDFVVGGLSYSVSDLYSMHRNGTLKGDLYEMVADFYQNNPGCSDDMARALDDGADAILKKQIHVEMPNLPEGSLLERNVLNSFASGNANPTTYNGGTTLYRVGGNKGGFWSLDAPPLTEYQWRVDFAIKQEFCNDASTLYKLTIPEGSTITSLSGTVGSQGMGLYGGAHQVYIDYRAVPDEWIETSSTVWK